MLGEDTSKVIDLDWKKGEDGARRPDCWTM